jgi:2-haloacid dehalogenase
MNKHHNSAPAIVFDFGGVLLEWNPHLVYGKYFNDDPGAIDRFLQEIGFAEWNLQQDKGRPFAEAVTVLSRQFPQYAHLIQAYDDRWEESIVGPIQPTVDILHLLKQSGHTLYALSNWSAETFPRIRHKYDFLDWFEDILVSGEVKLVKPDPRIFQVFLKRTGRTAEECLLIDDSEANIAAAGQLGFQTIRFETAHKLREDLLQRGLLTQNGDQGEK